MSVDLERIDAGCPACGADQHVRTLQPVAAEPPFAGEPWTVVDCSACASRYLRPRPARPETLYGDAYHVYRRPGRLGRAVAAVVARIEAARLARYVPRGGRVFELGCGIGDTLLALARRRFEVSGVEPAAAAVAIARGRGLRVEQGGFQERHGVSGGYDLVFAAHVLEHVADPAAFLGEVRRLVRPGGTVVLKTPLAGGWDADLFGAHAGSFDVPYHLLVPSRRALEGLLRDAGLELVRIAADPVPNDFVHGLRRSIRADLGVGLRILRPSNPVIALPFLPISVGAAIFGHAGRVRVVARKP